MAKTPFEIRSDLLHLASNSLEQQHSVEMEEWRRLCDIVTCNLSVNLSSVDEAVKFVNDLKEKMLKVPSAAAASQIIKRAEELYEFVTKQK